MATPLTQRDKDLLFSAFGLRETRDRVVELLELALTGDVSGPGSSTDNAVPRFDGITGTAIQDSSVLIDDSNNITGVSSLSAISALLSQYEQFDEQGSAPSAPAVGKQKIYFKNDGKFYKKNSANVETEIGASSGGVIGPGSSTDNALVRFDGITGALIQDSNAILDDTGSLFVAGNVGFGAASSTAALLTLSGNSLSGSSQHGILSTPTFTAPFDFAYGFRSTLTLPATASTLAINYMAEPMTGNPTGYAINYHGADQTLGSTGNAFLADNTSFSGNYFINYSGSRTSVLASTMQATAFFSTVIGTNSAAILQFKTDNTTRFEVSDSESKFFTPDGNFGTDGTFATGEVTGANEAGTLYLLAGSATAAGGTGGSVEVVAGSATNVAGLNGGSLTLSAGDSTAAVAGDVEIKGGVGVDQASNGKVVLYFGGVGRSTFAGRTLNTTDATVTTLFSYTLSDTTAHYFTVKVVAHETDAPNRATYERKVLVYREGGGALIQGVVQDAFTEESDATWDCTIDVTGNDMRVRVNGAGGQTVNWFAFVEQQRNA